MRGNYYVEVDPKKDLICAYKEMWPSQIVSFHDDFNDLDTH